MAAMFSTVTAWFGLIVGVVLLVEVAVFAIADRRRTGPKRTIRGPQPKMLLFLGILFTVNGADRIRHWTGITEQVLFVLGLAVASTVVVLAFRSLAYRDAAETREWQESGAGADESGV